MKSSISVVLWIAAAMFWIPVAMARNYYVSPTGSNANPGTLDQPFQTIQKAASVMVAGDTAFVRAGIYRETVTPARSGTQAAPITFQPYNGESVTISGADVVPSGSWILSSGRTYQAPIAWDLGEGANQVFLDGQMVIEARWPNTTLDVSRPIVALTGGGSYVDGHPGLSTGTITGLDLPSRPSGYWTGATIHIALFNASRYQGAGYGWQTGTVVNSTDGRLSFTWQRFPTIANEVIPGPRNPYFLSGKLNELDSGGEWFLDGVTSTLYLQTPAGDSPAQHLVEAKRRQYAFILSGRSFVTIQGFNLFAASILSNADSQHLVLDGLNARYVSHVLLIPNISASFVGVNNSGIFLQGRNNVLRNSNIAFSSGNGVQIAGPGHHVFNNVIHDTNYAANEASPIAAGFNLPTTNGYLIAWNTIYNAGRHGILHTNLNPNTGNGRILHNEIYNYGLQTTDLGCTYTYGSDGQGTEIAYNLCHHDSGTFLGTGVYLDFDSSNYLVHHNVVWDAQSSARLNSVSRNNKIYNNTFAAGTSTIGLVVTPGHDGTYQAPGSELKNNIFTARLNNLVLNSGAVVQNNILAGTDPQFVNPAQNDYQLKPTSPAIDAGVALPPYTDGFTGRAPDIGAYESGVPPWKAGAGQAIAAAVSAASYGAALAPESIATAFGPKLATGTAFATSIPLPTVLADTKVMVTDGAGVDRVAPLFFVFPTQIAFQIPAGTAPGVALITVTSGDGTISLGSAPVFAAAAGLFSADASGRGLAAAAVVRVRADGSQSYEPVLVGGPIDLGPETDQLILVLYGTGIRGRTALSAVTITVGGVNTPVLYAGPQNEFAGLDQVNVALPRSLAGRGEADVLLTVDGLPANTVTVNIR
ncbi:MAG: hypothetical protein HY316_09310 [Acidobacteria bacterium]|nr:hypothetical protein [Acidobacteriota bacterium]